MKYYLSVLHRTSLLIIVLLLTACATYQPAPDPLPSWTDSVAKKQITDFVNDITDHTSKDYLVPGKRIATFDNDGTLWSEKPTYFQLIFILERVGSMAVDHPQWKTT